MKYLIFGIFNLLLTLLIAPATAQILDVQSSPKASSMLDMSAKRKVKAIQIEWNANNLPSEANGAYNFNVEALSGFTFFAVGWLTDDQHQTDVSDFELHYRSREDGKNFAHWTKTFASVSADENPSGMYWSDILFVPDSLAHQVVEFKIIPPEGITISLLRLDLVNMQQHNAPKFKPEAKADKSVYLQQTTACEIPPIVRRDVWCNGMTNCEQATYQPQEIFPGHVIVHHGASPNSYIDGETIVRSYWNYHVYSNGWDDIGYNFLLDKDGNIYQGRYNNNIESVDVKGTHAGNVNSSAIGVCFLGNSDSLHATNVQLLALDRLLAWWFQSRGFDPTSSAPIINQAGTGYLYLPRIIGHRDVKPTTLCPGNHLYSLLPQIRSSVKNEQIACSGIVPHFDFALNDFTIDKSTYAAGDSVRFSLNLVAAGNISELCEKSLQGDIWLMASDVSDQLYNIYVRELNFDCSELADGQMHVDFQTAIDSGMVAGNYKLYVRLDPENLFYEIDETNNEKWASVLINELRYNVQLTTHDVRSGVVSGEGSFRYGDFCTLNANANYSYSFLHWAENGEPVSYSSEFSFKVVNNHQFEAVFECLENISPLEIEGETLICSGTDKLEYRLLGAGIGHSYQWEFPAGVSGTDNSANIVAGFGDGAQSGEIRVEVNTGCPNVPLSKKWVEVVETPVAPVIHEVMGVIYADTDMGNRWYWNNNEVAVTDEKFYIPSGAGFFNVSNSYLGCVSPKSNTLYFDPNMFEQETGESFVAFPNIASSRVTLVFANYLETKSQILISNTKGQILKKWEYAPGIRTVTINVNELNDGIFVLSVLSGKKNYTAKLIIKRYN